MNTYPLSHLNQQLEPEELEYWELKDFDEIQPSIEASEQENEPIWDIYFH